MKKILIFTVLAVIAIGCSKKDNEPPAPPVPPPTPDAYAAFKADATSRWESGTTVLKSEEAHSYVFVSDAGGSLFSSAKYKIGRIWNEGSNYELIEFSGTPAVGKPSDPSIRKPSGSVALYSLEILKVEGVKLWLVYKETASSAEGRIVQ